MTKADYIERYGEEAYRELLAKKKAYKEANKEKIAEHNKAYRVANKEKIAEYKKVYRTDNREKIAEYKRSYYSANSDRVKAYYSTKYGRATKLLSGYKRNDRKFNRGECTLTAEWIVENIFSGQVCHWCSESDWTKLGCDRIDNNLPHTPDNVICSCEDCNNARGAKTYDEYRRLLNTKIA